MFLSWLETGLQRQPVKLLERRRIPKGPNPGGCAPAAYHAVLTRVALKPEQRISAGHSIGTQVSERDTKFVT